MADVGWSEISQTDHHQLLRRLTVLNDEEGATAARLNHFESVSPFLCIYHSNASDRELFLTFKNFFFLRF